MLSVVVLPAGRVLAHAGGWDEALYVLAPVAALAGLLWAANRRADAASGAADVATDDDPAS